MIWKYFETSFRGFSSFLPSVFTLQLLKIVNNSHFGISEKGNVIYVHTTCCRDMRKNNKNIPLNINGHVESRNCTTAIILLITKTFTLLLLKSVNKNDTVQIHKYVKSSQMSFTI